MTKPMPNPVSTNTTAENLARVSAYAHDMRLIVLSAEEMEHQLDLPPFRRPLNEVHVTALKTAMEKGAFIPPGILIENTDGLTDRKYLLVDSQHRVKAAIEVGVSLAFVVITVPDLFTARHMFIALHRGTSIDPSFLVKLNPEMSPNAEIERINTLKGHPMCGRIWLGGPPMKVLPHMIRAAKLTSLTRRFGLAPEDLSEFLRFYATCFPHYFPESTAFACSLRAQAHFFAIHVQSKQTFKLANAQHVLAYARFSWPENCNEAESEGDHLYERLEAHWLKSLAAMNRAAVED